MNKSPARTPRSSAQSHSSGVNIIRSIINKYENKLVSLKSINRDTIIPIKLEDSNVVFEEVDLNKGGTVTIDELFYYVVDKMVGLPYTYRTQINKSLRKVYKHFDTEGLALDRMAFWKVMQFVFYWYLIYMKFLKLDDNTWATDEKAMKDSGLYTLIDGRNFKEKLDHLTKGRRADVATFQDYIDYYTDVITYSIEARDRYLSESMNEYEHLKMRLKLLEDKCREYQGYLLESEVTIASLRKTDEHLTNCKLENNRLVGEKDSLRQNIKEYTVQQNNKVEELLKKNNSLEQQNVILMDEKNQSIVTFNNLINDLKSSMGEERKSLELTVTKLKEESKFKDAELRSQVSELSTLNDSMTQLESVVQKLDRDKKELIMQFNEFKAATNAERDDLMRVISNAERNLAEYETSFHQEKSKNEILQSQLNSQEQSQKNLETNYVELKSDLSKTMEELRHYKQIAHEKEINQKEKQHENDALKEKIKTLNSSLVEVKGSFEGYKFKYEDLLKKSIDFDSEVKRVQSEMRKEKNTAAYQQQVIKSLTEQVGTLSETINDKVIDLNEIKLKCEEYKNENNRLNHQVSLLETNKASIDASANDFLKITQQYQDLSANIKTDEDLAKIEQKYMKKLKRLGTEASNAVNSDNDMYIIQMSEKDSLIKELQNRIAHMEKGHQEINSKLFNMKDSVSSQQYQQLKTEFSELKDNLIKVEASKIMTDKELKSLKETNLKQSHDLDNYHKIYADESQLLREQLKKAENAAKLAEMNFQSSKKENEILSNKIADLLKRIAELEKQIKENQKTILDLNGEITDLKEVNNELKVDIETMTYKFEKLHEELRNSNEKFDEKKFAEIENIALQHRKSLIPEDLNFSEKDLVSGSVMNNSYMEKTKKRYKDESIADIDTKIKLFYEYRESINKGVKLKFVKVKEGIYKYGLKTLNLKVLKGGILVRVGGGWTDVDSYIDKHEENELNNIELTEKRKNLDTSEDYEINVLEESKNFGRRDSHTPMNLENVMKKNILDKISKTSVKGKSPKFN